MLGRRSPQGALFRPDHTLRDHVGERSLYGLLAQHGAEWFSDETFAGLYREDFGRPSVPPSQLCVALLLQVHEGVSDAEAVARSAYDLRWKVALGLELDEKLCAKSTLQQFRAKLVLHEAYGQLFETSVAACRKAGVLPRGKLETAIDTTPVLGRGAVKDTFNLVSDQIRRVVEEACRLKGWDRAAVVAEQGLSRHCEAASFKGAVDLDWTDAEARRALVGQLVADARVGLALAREALRGFAAEAERARPLREAQRLLADLLQQDVEEAPADGAGPQIRRGTAPDRIVSTTDPEMRHGHKSHAKGFDGYKATVVVETTSGVILATGVCAGNAADREQAAERITQAQTHCDGQIDCVLGDTAYGDTATRAQLEAKGIEIVAKVPPGTREGMFSLDDFRVEPKRGVVRCPAKRRSLRRDRVHGDDPGWRYVFSRKDCSPCPLRARCTKGKHAARTVRITTKTEALQRLRRVQRTHRFRRRYRRRVVVEHRIARLVQLGIRQARYFRKAKVSFQVALTATVANLSLVLGALAAPRVLRAVLRHLHAWLHGLRSLTQLALPIPAGTWLATSLPLAIAPSRPGL
jgi:hypothetical protein